MRTSGAGAVVAVAACLLSAAGAQAQVKITEAGNGRYEVAIDGKPFGDLYTSRDVAKPFFSPLRTADGKIVTRLWPMEPNSGTTRDHQHHRGLWIGYIAVNGINFWENEFSYHRANGGVIVAEKVDIVKSGGKTGVLHGVFDWNGPSGQKVLTEDRTMTFSGDAKYRVVDLDVTLTAAVKAEFGDDKDGAVGVRMADGLTEKEGGVITDSQGRTGMKEVWGKRADWCDYTGTLGGERVGLTIFEHPTSFHHPTRWHARDYGLLAANPFADHAYDPAAPERHVTLEPGKSLHLRFRVVVHGEVDRAALDDLYKAYSKEK